MARLAGILLGAAAFFASAVPGSAGDEMLLSAARTNNLQLLTELLAKGTSPNGYQTYSPLMFAAGSGNAEATRLLLARGAETEYRDHNGDRALLWAAYGGHLETVRLLLEAGSPPDSAGDPHRITPLMKASRYGREAVVRLLLARGADARLREHTDENALHGATLARSAPIVKLLLDAGADPRAASKYIDETPLHIAAGYDAAEIAGMLLARGVDINARDRQGKTPLWRAASLGHAAIVEMLLAAGADPDAASAGGDTPFMAALGKGEGTAASVLVKVTRALDSGFISATTHGRADFAKALAERGADINAVDPYGRPALAGVASHPGTGMLDWFLEQRVDLGRHGPAALGTAAGAGRVDLLTRLLDSGVPIDARWEGATALLRAAGAGKVDAVRLLLERGADRRLVDEKGRGPEEYMEIAQSLLRELIAQREASRALRPTGELRQQFAELVRSHAEIRQLLAVR